VTKDDFSLKDLIRPVEMIIKDLEQRRDAITKALAYQKQSLQALKDATTIKTARPRRVKGTRQITLTK
jgi:ribosomal protein S11